MDNSLLNYIGNTPLVELKNIEEKYKLKSKLFAKLEMFNLSGSIKIRIAKEIILDGINKGLINNKTTIIEATSGNTGIALACICAQMKLKLIIVMPENMSIERQKLIKIYGGKIILTQKNKGMKGSLKKVEELKNKYRFIKTNSPSLVYCVAKNHPYAGRKSVTCQEIAAAPITVMDSDSYPTEELRRNLSEAGLEPNIIHYTNQVYTVERFVESGTSAGFLPEELVKDNPRLVALHYPWYRDDLFTMLLWKKEQMLYPSVKVFIRVAHQYLKMAGDNEDIHFLTD